MVDRLTLTEAEVLLRSGKPAEHLLRSDWFIKPPFYHPTTGAYVNRAWNHPAITNTFPLTPAHHRYAAAHQIPGAKHEGGWLYEGEHTNNGASWMSDYREDGTTLYLSVREIYEVIDPSLPYPERFRTLRIELVVSRGEESLGVWPLPSKAWFELGSLAINAGLWAGREGL